MGALVRQHVATGVMARALGTLSGLATAATQLAVVRPPQHGTRRVCTLPQGGISVSHTHRVIAQRGQVAAARILEKAASQARSLATLQVIGRATVQVLLALAHGGQEDVALAVMEHVRKLLSRRTQVELMVACGVMQPLKLLAASPVVSERAQSTAVRGHRSWACAYHVMSQPWVRSDIIGCDLACRWRVAPGGTRYNSQ